MDDILGNVFYFGHINVIGGVETMFYELVRKYGEDYDITIYYKTIDHFQLLRLSKYVRLIRYTGVEYVVCKRCFFNYNLDIIDHVKAEEYIQIIHADYKVQGIKPVLHPKITKYVAVSRLAAKSFEELTGQSVEVCYNPLTVDPPRKVLNLISATRLTSEKGKDRMIRLGQLLDDSGVPYLWTIFTNDPFAINNPRIVYMKPRSDVRDYLANADYTVQLSDCESYCYTVVESLCVGTPIIATDLPVYKELGITEDHGFLLSLDFEDIPIDEICNKKFSFDYSPVEDTWSDLLVEGRYSPTFEGTFRVRARPTYVRYGIKDRELDRVPRLDDIWSVDHERLEILLGRNPRRLKFVEVIDQW